MALSFYHLPLALAAAPVGLALLPRLSRMTDDGAARDFAAAYQRAVGLALFLVVPAALGYLVLAIPLAHVVAAGQMSTSAGVAMVAGSLSALALGLVGETLFVISTQAAYARGDASSPLRSMVLQAVVCAVLAVPAGLLDGRSLVTALSGAFAIASVVGGVHLSLRVRGELAEVSASRWPSVMRTTYASVVMAAVAWSTAAVAIATLGGTSGWLVASTAGTAGGAVAYLGVHRMLGSDELRWLLDGAYGGRSRATVVESSPA